MSELLFEGTGADRVFYYFTELSKIPHGSGNMKAISDYVMDFACRYDLDAQQDAFYNVIIRKPASPGREGDPSVLLQGHLDMVAVADDGVDFDFSKDSLRLMIDGDYLTADGTTLGADDGIAVAMCLAILEDTSISSPELECVFTVDEEIGMEGAMAMDLSDIKSRFMLNIDCDVEGTINIGCAGGVRAHCRVPLTRNTQIGCPAKISISGLQGGHSGAEIHKNRVNGLHLIFRVLRELKSRCDIDILAVKGGSADNAIPAQASADILVEGPGVFDTFQVIMEEIKEEIGDRDPGLIWDMKMLAEEEEAAVWADAMNILKVVTSMPNGVQAMSKEIPDLVETSLNLGICNTAEDALILDTSIRSSKGEEKKKVQDILSALAEEMDAEISFTGEYPGWPALAESPLQDLACASWKDITGMEMKKEAIHAGLECGVFSTAIPGIDIIAFGPDMLDIHSPRERLSIPSTIRCYKFLCRMLQMIH